MGRLPESSVAIGWRVEVERGGDSIRPEQRPAKIPKICEGGTLSMHFKNLCVSFRGAALKVVGLSTSGVPEDWTPSDDKAGQVPLDALHQKQIGQDTTNIKYESN